VLRDVKKRQAETRESKAATSEKKVRRFIYWRRRLLLLQLALQDGIPTTPIDCCIAIHLILAGTDRQISIDLRSCGVDWRATAAPIPGPRRWRGF
jgi:hypothetical protein